MLKGYSKIGLKVLVLVLSSMAFFSSQVFASDWTNLIGKAEAKYANFNKEVKDMTMVQEMKIVTPEGEMTSEMKMMRKGEKYRVVTKMSMPNMPKGMGEMETIIISDGKDTWMISSFAGKQKLPEGDEVKHQGNLGWWDSFSKEAEITGSETIKGRDCYVVKFKEEAESYITRVWIDKNELFLVKSESKGDKGGTMTMLYSDFRKIKGNWEMPYETEIFSDDKLVSTMTMKSIEINKGLSDDLFDPDKVEVKGMDMQEMMKMMQKGG